MIARGWELLTGGGKKGDFYNAKGEDSPPRRCRPEGEVKEGEDKDVERGTRVPMRRQRERDTIMGEN